MILQQRGFAQVEIINGDSVDRVQTFTVLGTTISTNIPWAFSGKGVIKNAY